MGENDDDPVAPHPASGPAEAELLEQYGCGPIRFSGHSDALYERHFDRRL